MPADKTIIWQFPIKGKDDHFATRDQPQLTCPDCLNVMPYDVYAGRMRGGQRPGTDNLYPVLESGAAIQHLLQCSTAVDPSTIEPTETNILTTPDGTSTDSTFTYANANIMIATSGRWWTSFQNAGLSHCFFGLSGGAGQTTGAISVLSNKAKCVNTNVTYFAAAVYTQSLVLGASYVIRMTLRRNYSYGYSGGIVFRVAEANNAGLALQVSTGAMFFKEQGNVTPLAQVSNAAILAAADTDYTIEVRINGSYISAWQNGTQYLSVVSSLYAANARLGFFLGGSGDSNTITVDDFQVFTGQHLASYRQNNLVTVAGGSIYVGDEDSTALATGGSGVLSTNVPYISAAFADGKAYYTDSYVIKQLDLTTKTVSTYAATVGTAPTDCTLACMWHGRLVLAAPKGNMQNWFMSRLGTYTDWAYLATDVARAIDGNSGPTWGKIGDIITALIPFNDDVLIFGLDHGIRQMTGDPAAGGSIETISNDVGIAGPNAWCLSPDGILYFVGQGGFYRLVPGGRPEAIGGNKQDSFFSAINRGTHYVRLMWDTERGGCWIFVTSVTSATSTNLWWDATTDGFFPQRFPDDHGPLAGLVYDGDDPLDRLVLLGGRDGYVRRLTLTSINDDGDAVSSYVWLGPIRPVDDLNRAKLVSMDTFLGEQPPAIAWKCQYSLQVAADAYLAINNPAATATGTFIAGGRQVRLRQRLNGGSVALKLFNTTKDYWWSMERIIVRFAFGGRQR